MDAVTQDVASTRETLIIFLRAYLLSLITGMHAFASRVYVRRSIRHAQN